ncbi:MAG: DNA-processing protein DprA [Muribaculaceae bacterium]
MLPYKIAFASLKGMCSELAQRILDIIPSEKEFFDLSEKELENTLGTKSKIMNSDYRKKALDKALKEIDFITKNDIGITYFTDNTYPTRFLNAPDAPILFFTKGDCNLNAPKVISIVGTRHATTYGQHFTETIINEISESFPKTIIVSGLAYGIDICAHKAALNAGLPTVAVLAHGLNTIYPAQHRNSAINIIRNGGALLTDYTSQDIIHRANFIARNRIVAALSDCTIVVESASKGGALITAGIAESYNRDVFALPGRSSDQYSEGCNKLIRLNAASLITCADDLINAMRWEKPKSNQPKEKQLFPDLSTEEQPIVDYITTHGETHINALSGATNIPISQLLSLLVELEFKGILLSAPGGRYTIA